MWYPEKIDIRGSLTKNANLGARSWFRAGGTAQLLFEPADKQDLILFLSHYPPAHPILFFGQGSNLLVRDGGIKGVVIAPHFTQMSVQGDEMDIGASVLAPKLALFAYQNGLSGFEFLRGIPGSIGGCLAMNAGAYGCQIEDKFIRANAIDRFGKEHILYKQDMDFGYRQAVQGFLFTSAVFKAERGDKKAIKTKMDSITKNRKASQPAGGRTGGSTFKNPPQNISDKKAWQLIEDAQCRDLSFGDARICEKHCNFLVNQAHASAQDIENLGEAIRAQVKEKQGVELEWEIRRVGEKKLR